MKDPREAVYCRYCPTRLEWIYDSKLRDICDECLEEIRMTRAEQIARKKRRKKDVDKTPPKK